MADENVMRYVDILSLITNKEIDDSDVKSGFFSFYELEDGPLREMYLDIVLETLLLVRPEIFKEVKKIL
ncbi:MAG: hypothetical protein COY69_01565 [Candidatus Magasanikbacteria bacterium CG_4_10_14_0_8_um_filter_32_14]|uniref:Uncharacterized protein n=1 Tax=Candidatus Magasanikbacteria bacterium CG_4_10_14_0_8_um_filter_32_14 TaxID=1974640 RepID=A0A2M7RAT6_9BACT|nr:MAG: hypothetical protein COY69_01565 [Candidatus Magasanikbacteria bacterium CG_4_10_14_0_8_um_filter_32_14]